MFTIQLIKYLSRSQLSKEHRIKADSLVSNRGPFNLLPSFWAGYLTSELQLLICNSNPPMAYFQSFLGGASGQEPTCQRRLDVRDMGQIPGSGRHPGGRAWPPTPISLPGESHGQRSLASCSSQGRKEQDITEVICTYKIAGLSNNNNLFFFFNSTTSICLLLLLFFDTFALCFLPSSPIPLVLFTGFLFKSFQAYCLVDTPSAGDLMNPL